MSGLRHRECHFNRLDVPQLTNQNEIRVLAQNAFERVTETLGVRAYLPLIHDAILVLVDKFDRIFDGNHVAEFFAIENVQQRSQCRGLTTARGTGDQNQAIWAFDYFSEDDIEKIAVNVLSKLNKKGVVIFVDRHHYAFFERKLKVLEKGFFNMETSTGKFPYAYMIAIKE